MLGISTNDLCAFLDSVFFFFFNCRTGAAAGDRGSGGDWIDRRAGRAAGCRGGGTCPGKGRTFGRAR